MPFFSNSKETAERYGKYIAEFQDLFRRHEVKFGAQEDFFQLAPKLAYDDRFRVDFSGLTKSVGQQERGRLTLTRILTIIAIAMGGEGIEESGSASAVPISLVVVFLAGVGGWSETEPAAETAGPRGETEREFAGKPAETNEELEALELEHRLSEGTNDFEGLTASLFAGPALVKEALSRLEINTLALKLHLDSIDSRMERIEPHLDDLTARFTSTASPVPAARSETERSKASLPVQRYSQPEVVVPEVVAPAGVAPAVVMPEVVAPAVVAPEVVAPEVDAPEVVAGPGPAVLPISSGSSQLRRLHGLVAMLGVLLFVLAGATALLLYVNRGRQLREQEESRFAGAKVEAAREYGPVTARGEEITGSPGAAGGPGRNDPPAGEQTASTRPAVGAQMPTTVTQRQQNSERLIPERVYDPAKIHIEKEKEAPAVAKDPGFRMTEGLPSGVTASGVAHPVVIAELNPTVAGGVAGAPAMNTAGPLRNPAPSSPVLVASEVLRRSAIWAPTPSYPWVARLRRVEGNVILQTQISETGRVESVSVVRGPPELRAAAVDAMRNWRFKPYMVNGAPAKVRTYFNFHFVMGP